MVTDFNICIYFNLNIIQSTYKRKQKKGKKQK